PLHGAERVRVPARRRGRPRSRRLRARDDPARALGDRRCRGVRRRPLGARARTLPAAAAAPHAAPHRSHRGGRMSIVPRLPRAVWLLQLGGLLNFFGNGVVFPFLVIYLHDVRGFSLATSGLVVAVSSAAQLVVGIGAGPLIDRIGPRRTLAAGLVLQAAGFGLFPLAREPWHAFVLIAIEGAGSAGFWPSQSTLLSRLVDDARRHTSFALQRATMNVGIGLGGVVGGSIADVSRPSSFTV